MKKLLDTHRKTHPAEQPEQPEPPANPDPDTDTDTDTEPPVATKPKKP